LKKRQMTCAVLVASSTQPPPKNIYAPSSLDRS
jgi:hypothetical protein